MLRIAALLVGYLALTVAGAGVIGHYLPGSDIVLIGWSAVSVYLLAGAPIALLIFAGSRRLVPSLLAVALLALAVLVQAPLAVQGAPGSGPRLTALTVNLLLGRADAAAVVKLVTERHVDVLMLEELTSAERARLRAAGLDAVLPHSKVEARAAAGGVGLWSRYELADRTSHAGFHFALLSARVMVPGASRPPLAVALHVAGPYPDNASGWKHDIGLITRFLAGLTSADPAGPIIAGGDFNATWDNREFRRLLQHGYHDATEQSGSGLVATYPAWFPLIGIDHVLLRGAVAESARAIRVGGTDHRGLLVQLRLSVA